MGNRSNLIIINKRTQLNPMVDQKLVTGIALYSHFGGQNMQFHALSALQKLGSNRVDEPGYFNRIATRAFTRGDDGECGSSVLPVAFLEDTSTPRMDAVGNPVIDPHTLRDFILDNDDHLIPVIDISNSSKKVAIMLYSYDFFTGLKHEITYTGRLLEVLPQAAAAMVEYSKNGSITR